MARVSLRGVTRRFAPGAAAVDAIDLDVADGEFMALLGPSGCGKTTLLRLIAGFERPDAGTVVLGGETVADGRVFVPPERRRIAMVFQSYALWPHMDVRRNVGYPLEVAGVRGAEYERAVQQALAAVGLSGFESRRPASLSGGQRQRVALARCLAMAPKLVLLDEPLANLDVHLRAALQAEFARMHAALGATMIYVTHDQAEALALADRVAVMDRGRILQIAPPRELYRRPRSPAVAAFVGRGQVLQCTVTGRIDDARVAVELFGRGWPIAAAPGQAPGPAAICLRPEDLALAEGGVPARVIRCAFLGASGDVELSIGGEVLHLQADADAAPAPGSEVTVALRGGWVIPEPDAPAAPPS